MAGFLFDRDFDDELDAEAEAPALAAAIPAAPNPDEMAQHCEALRAAAYAEGFAAGAAEAELRLTTATETEVAQSLAALVPALQGLQGDIDSYRRQSSRDLAQMSLFLAERLLPEIQERFAARRLEAFCRRAARLAEGEAGAEIRLAPAMLAEIAPRLEGLRTATQAPLRLVGDPTLSAAQVSARWCAGGADLAIETLHAEVLATLSSIAQTSAPDGQ